MDDPQLTMGLFLGVLTFHNRLKTLASGIGIPEANCIGISPACGGVLSLMLKQ